MARSRAAVKGAKDEQGFLRAANEFKEAVRAAPWLAEGYYNLGVVQDKAGSHDDAIRNLKLYILAAPDAPDIKQVRNIIYEIEYRQEEAKRQRQEEQRQQAKLQKLEKQRRADKARKIQQLSGTWQNARRKNRYRVTVTGNTIDIVHTALYFRGQWRSQDVNRGCSDTWRGTIEGSTIRGSWSRNWACIYKNGRMFTYPMTGTISEDGNTIRLKFTAAGPAGSTGDVADGWTEWIQEELLTR